MDASGLKERLPGFDVAGALERLGGMDDLYVEVLGSFCDEQSTAMNEIRNALSAGDSDGARRVTHTLKGLAGTVGASSLESSALALEQGIDGGASGDVLEPLVASCERELDSAIAAIRALQ